MKTASDTVTLINPWSKAEVQKPIADIVRCLNNYPWPDDLREEVHMEGHDTDAAWVAAMVEHLGPEQAGIIILGS